MGSASLKGMVGPSKRKVVEKIKRDILQKGTHYIVKEVPPHSLQFDSSFNAKILKDFKEILKDEGWSCLVIRVGDILLNFKTKEKNVPTLFFKYQYYN
ncbi:hypothetical protein P3L10_021248 [Capsicum annuum]